jgi:mono/diheme cytochrome c family protein
MKIPGSSAWAGVRASGPDGTHPVLVACAILATVLLSGLAVIPQTARAQTAKATPQTKKGRTVLDGVYTAAQAARGETAYTKTCAECHDLSFDGTPVDGSGFIDNWREFPLDVLYTFISTTMPEDNPGELSEDGYRDVLAYLLKRNGYPEGRSDLTTDVIKSTTMVGLEGPQPLASEMIVKTVGCFTAGPDNTWDLAQSSDPVRIRKADTTSPVEIQSAAATPRGAQKFKLVNLEYFQAGAGVQTAFSPDSYKGQKVLTKGALVKDSYGARINVMAMEKLGVSCGP